MLLKASFQCAEVPAPIEYAVLRPDENADPRLPLLMVFHGGGQSRDYLERVRGALQRAWSDGALPPVLAVTPTISQRGHYVNARDGGERWEDALLGPFLEHVCTRHGADRTRVLAMGVAYGGSAALRFGFKHPQRFLGVAALEPTLFPVLDFHEVELRDRYWQDQKLLEMAYGTPIDEAYWRANHATSIAHDHPDDLTELPIYFECGDQDAFGLYRGCEFLHRVLYDAGISHEFRMVRGADHVGATMPARFRDALEFLAKALNPPPADPSLEGFHKIVRMLKQKAGLDPDAP